eukprot:gene17004-19445_t
MFCGLLAVSRGLRGGVNVLEGRMQHALHLSSVAAASSISTDASSGTNAVPTRRQKKAAAAASVPKEPQNIHDAVTLVQQLSWARFDESVDIVINTGLDPRKPNQNVKGVAKLPHGQGKKVRVCVIAQGDDVVKAKQAGADVAGAEEIILLIQQGDVSFNTVIATPQMMAQVGKIGKILGPRGLMPSPKMGTVTNDVIKAVKDAKAGAVQFKTERQGVVHAALGKVSFQPTALLDNSRSFM